MDEFMTADLRHGDCLELMRSLPDASVDCVITDPPYDAKTHDGADKRYSDITFAPLVEPAELTRQLLRLSRRWVVVFCSLEMLGDYKVAAGDAWVRGGIWDRISNMPQLSGDRPAQGGEGVAIMHRAGRKRWNGGGRAAVWRHLVERGEKLHPTQKPLDLMRELVLLFSEAGDTILDPFMGSGTTGVAAIQEGRAFIGMELDPAYYAIAQARVQAAVDQPRLLEAIA